MRGLVVALAVAAAGCCSPARLVKGDRDTPERAFDFVREAFAADSLPDQYDSFHVDFRERHGISYAKYSLARSLRPGLFEDAGRLLGKARLESMEPVAPVGTPAGPRLAMRMSLRTADGSAGVFLLVDEPRFLLVTDDVELPRKEGSVSGIDKAVKVKDGALEVVLRVPLGKASPVDGARILRFEVHHDWLLYAVESLEGLEALLDEAAAAAEETRPAEAPK